MQSIRLRIQSFLIFISLLCPSHGMQRDEETNPCPKMHLEQENDTPQHIWNDKTKMAKHFADIHHIRNMIATCINTDENKDKVIVSGFDLWSTELLPGVFRTPDNLFLETCESRQSNSEILDCLHTPFGAINLLHYNASPKSGRARGYSPYIKISEKFLRLLQLKWMMQQVSDTVQIYQYSDGMVGSPSLYLEKKPGHHLYLITRITSHPFFIEPEVEDPQNLKIFHIANIHKEQQQKDLTLFDELSEGTGSF